MAKPSIFRELYLKGLDQFIPFVVTILAILVTDLLVGILIGCAVGLFFVMCAAISDRPFSWWQMPTPISSG